LKFLIGECNYGGRVTDMHDIRTLRAFIEDFFSEKIFDDNYSLSESGNFKIPSFREY